MTSGEFKLPLNHTLAALVISYPFVKSKNIVCQRSFLNFFVRHLIKTSAAANKMLMEMTDTGHQVKVQFVRGTERPAPQ